MTPFRVEAHLASVRGDARSLAALPREERQVAARIASASRRATFIAARSFARELVAQRIGCSPAEVPIVCQADGKPRVLSGGIELSLSHAGAWIAVALSTDGAVGVDVEPVRPLAGMAEIAAELFPAAARADLAAVSEDERPIVFFRWWTRIEAAVKASGRGLDDALACFDGVSYESCELVPGLAMAVAARAAGPLRVDWNVAI
jgi:4'-phosphopantetheinyl transferase